MSAHEVSMSSQSRVSARRILACLMALSAVAAYPAQRAQAETIVFDVPVHVDIPRPKPCPDGVFVCATAMIPGLGTAEYRLSLLGPPLPAPGECDSPSGASAGGIYTALVTFTLADGSTLTLSETVLACGPGFSLSTPAYTSYGNPVDATGKWQVQNATGQFTGFTGLGTDVIHTAGAEYSASYNGTLTR